MNNDLILYSTEDGQAQVYLKKIDGQIWLNQYEIADLFGVDRTVILKHISNIYNDGELLKEATCAKFAQVQNEGSRSVTRQIEHYNLDMILAVGLRVRSVRGTQFRLWAINNLKEYLIKGFVINSEQLKETVRYDYFDELLQKIRDIRASEKRFYQKIRDLFALSSDYKGNEAETGIFFATVQNKLLFAVTGYTAADLIMQRANAKETNMGLTSFSGSVVRKTDIYIAKNYLNATEIEQLNRLVSMFLDYAEDKASRKEQITLENWKQYVDNFVAFNEYPILTNAGKIGHDKMRENVSLIYEEFDKRRKEQAQQEADLQDISELEASIKELVDERK